MDLKKGFIFVFFILVSISSTLVALSLYLRAILN